LSISAVILAGGKSSRMGKDKALLPFGEYSTMTEYVYRKLEPIFGDKIYVSTKIDKFPFYVKKVYDKYDKITPLNGIISALESINSDAILVIAVDMPLISHNTINNLILSYKKNKNYDFYCYIIDGNIEPTVAIYTKSIIKKLKRNMEENRFKLREILEQCNIKCLNNVNKEEFANLNKIEDYLTKKI